MKDEIIDAVSRIETIKISELTDIFAKAEI